MTRDDLFIALGNTKSDYLLAAAASMQVKPRPIPRLRLRYAIIAATLALLVALIPIAVILANRTPAPPPPVTTPLPNPPAPSTHLSITDLPGAITADQTDLPLMGNNFTGKLMTPYGADTHNWIDHIQENYSSVLGTVKESKSVIVHDGDFRYHITQLLFSVEQTYHNTHEQETISLIYVHTYKIIRDAIHENNRYTIESQYIPTSGYRSDINMGYFATEMPHGLCVFEPAANHSLTVDNQIYDLSQYADYYLVAHLMYIPADKCFQLPHVGTFYRECFENDHTEKQHVYN